MEAMDCLQRSVFFFHESHQNHKNIQIILRLIHNIFILPKTSTFYTSCLVNAIPKI